MEGEKTNRALAQLKRPFVWKALAVVVAGVLGVAVRPDVVDQFSMLAPAIISLIELFL